LQVVTLIKVGSNRSQLERKKEREKRETKVCQQKPPGQQLTATDCIILDWKKGGPRNGRIHPACLSTPTSHRPPVGRPGCDVLFPLSFPLPSFLFSLLSRSPALCSPTSSSTPFASLHIPSAYLPIISRLNYTVIITTLSPPGPLSLSLSPSSHCPSPWIFLFFFPSHSLLRRLSSLRPQLF